MGQRLKGDGIEIRHRKSMANISSPCITVFNRVCKSKQPPPIRGKIVTLPRFFPAFSARPSTRTDVIRALIGSLVCLLHWPRLTIPSLLSGVVKRAKYASAREIARHEVGHTRVAFLANGNFLRALRVSLILLFLRKTR